MELLYEAKNLFFSHYKSPLTLKNVSFKINKGEKVLLCAVDGMGKTTSVNVLSSFDNKYYGSIYYNGKDLKQIKDNDKLMSIIYSEPVFIKSTVKDNLEFLCKTLNINMGEINLDKIFSEFNVKFKLETKINNLSLLDKIILCLIRCYIKKSKLIFIDNIFEKIEKNDDVILIKNLIDDKFKESSTFITCGDKEFSKFSDEILSFNFNKLLYLSYGEIFEYKTYDEFICKNIDVNVQKFAKFIKKQSGFAFFDGMSYFIEINFVQVKLDKKFNSKLSKLEITEGDREDIIIEYNENTTIDFTNNEKVNKQILEGEIMIFQTLDGSRIV